MKKISARVTAFAAALVLGSAFGFASAKQGAFAETAAETAPRVIYAGRESSAAGSAQESAPRVIFAGQYVSGGTSDETETTSAGAAAGTSAEIPASTAQTDASTTVQTDVSAAQAAATGSISQQAAGSTRHRKTAEELQAAMATVPAGPAKAEWGTFFLGNNLPPRNDEAEPYLRRFHAYAMVPTEEKFAYLTFDQGYENGYTPAILDILAKHRIKVAFFCTGSYIRDNPELVKCFADEGHIIGNHTLSHPNMMNVSTWDEFSRQLLTVEEQVRAITGRDMPRYYRPPSGWYSEAQLRMADAMGYRTIFWSVAYKDWDPAAQPTHERAMSYLTTRIHPGAIILLHAVSKTNTEVLDELLTTWEQMGYHFRTLDELPEGLN